MYVVVEGVIWKITAEGEWVQIPPSEIIDNSVPFIDERAHVNEIFKTQPTDDDVTPSADADTAPRHSQSSEQTTTTQDLSSNSASFIARIQATLDETIPEAGFITRPTESIAKNNNDDIGRDIPPLRNSAALTVTIVDGGDGYENQFEVPTVDLFGDAFDVEDGRIVAVTITDINGNTFKTHTVVKNQQWAIDNQDLSELAEGPLDVYASVTDYYGNFVDATDKTIKDTLAEISAEFEGNGDNYLNQFEVSISDLLGSITFVENNQAVTITITDSQGKTISFETTNNDGKWNINAVDLSSLAEGELTILAETVDIAGNPASATDTIIKDTLADISANFEGNGDEFLNLVEVTATDLFGSVNNVENGQTVTITVTDNKGAELSLETTIIDGKWTVNDADLSSLAEGELTVLAETVDIAGNPASATDTITKDTLADITANFEGNGDEFLNRFEVPVTDLFGSVDNIENNQPVTITVTDGKGVELSFETTIIDGKWTVNDANLSSLAEGELTILAETVDIAGNPASATDTIIKDTLADITANFEGNGDEFLNSDEIADKTTLFGDIAFVEDNQAVEVTVTDKDGKTLTFNTIIISGAWSIDDVDLSSLADGELTVTAKTTDIAGNPAEASDTIEKDTSALTIDIDTSQYQLGGLSITAIKNGAITFLQGTTTGTKEGDAVNVTFSDGINTVTLTTTVDKDGHWRIENFDLSVLDPAKIWQMSATVNDAAGNSASDDMPTLTEPSNILFFENALDTHSDLKATSSINIEYAEFSFHQNQTILETLTSHGEPVTVIISDDGLHLTVKTATTTVLTAVINTETKSIKVTLLAPVDNNIGNNDTQTGILINGLQTDGDKTSETVVANVPIYIKDSVPKLVDDQGDLVEGNTITGNVLTNDIDLDSSLLVTSITINGETKVLNGGSVTFELSEGKFIITANGEWTFIANRNLDHQSGDIQLDISYSAIDKDLQQDSATLTITIKDGEANSIIQSDANNIEKIITTASESYNGEFTVKAGSDNPDPNSVVFNAQTITALNALNLTSGANSATLEYTLSDNGKTITASVNGQTIFTLSISSVVSGNDLTGTVTLTQYQPLNHHSPDDTITLPLYIDAADLDGTKTPTGQFDWFIKDGADPELVANSELSFDENNLSAQPIEKTGTLHITVGSDGLNGTAEQNPLYFDISQLPTGLTSGGQAISYIISDDNQTITAKAGGNIVFEISLSARPNAESNSSVDYTFKLYQSLDQTAANGELPISIPVFVKDNDGDVSQTTLDIVIIDGSDPIITSATLVVTEEPIATDTSTGIDSTASATISITAGQDPIIDLKLALSGTVKDSDGNNITHNGQTLTWQVDGSNTYNATLADGTVIFTIQLSDIGTVPSGGSITATIDFQLNSFIDHINGKNTQLDLKLPIQVTDSDSSTGTSEVTVTIWDGLVPSITVNDSLAVQENDLLDDNLDKDASTTAAPTLTFNTGSDEIASVHLDTALFNNQNYTSGGANITLGAPNANGWYTAKADGNNVFRIKVNLDGTVQFELFAPIDHPDPNSQDTLGLAFGVIVTDSDGDQSDTAIFEVNVTDDVPLAGEDGTLTLIEGEQSTVQLLTDTITGADGGKVLEFTYQGKTYLADGTAIDLINTNVSPEQKYGTLIVNADGSVIINTIASPEGSGHITDHFTYTVQDSDGDIAVRKTALTLADEPGQIIVEPINVLEDTLTTPLSIKVSLGDIDQNETLSTITISESSLAGGTLYLNGTLLTAVGGVITLSDFVKEGDFFKPNGNLTYQPALDTALNQQPVVNLDITATITTSTTDKVLNTNLTINVYPDADAPIWDETKEYEYTGVEDDSNGIQLNVGANLQDTDSSESLKYKITGIPDGITLKLGSTVITNGKVINANQINNIKIFSDKNLAGKFTFTLTAIAIEKGDQFLTPADKREEASREITVNIRPDADTPTLSVKNIKGLEDQAINLSNALIGRLTDTDGSESLSYQIKVPEGWSIQGGDAVETPAGSGIYIVSAADIANGTALLHPKADISSWTEKLTIEVTAISTESTVDGLTPVNEQAVSDTKLVTIDLKGVIDRPDVADGGNGHWVYEPTSTDNSTGFKGTIKGVAGFYEDQPQPLDFLITTSDDDGSEDITILITNLPDGVAFVDINGNPLVIEIVGEDATTGLIYRITHDQLTTSYLKTPKDFSGSLKFDVNVISTEPDGDSGEFNYKVDIDVLPIVDETDGALLNSSGNEDEAIRFLVEPSITKDSDNSESLTGYKIISIPDGLTLFINGTAVSVPAGGLDLAAYKDSAQSWSDFINSNKVTIKADEDLSGIFDIAISYEVTDTSPTGKTASKELNATIQVDIAGIVESDTRLISTKEVLTSTDGSPIDLTNTVHFIDEDLDGSEYLDYIIIEVPAGINLIIDYPNGAYIDGNGNWIIPATGLTSDSIKEAMQDLFAGAKVSSKVDTNVITLNIKARVIDDEDSRFIEAPLQIQITGHSGGGSCLPIDAPDNIQSGEIVAKEGENIDLSGLLNGNIDDNPEVELSFFIDINDLPEGVEIEGPGIITEYNDAGEVIGYTITESGLSSMVFVGLDEDWAGCLDIPITITQTSTCNGQKSTTTQNIKIDVAPVVDDITITTTQTTVKEDNNNTDTPVDLNLEILLGDSVLGGQSITGEGDSATGKETINWMKITLVPGGTLMGDASILTQNPDGSWQILDPARLNEIQVLLPENYSGDLTINVEANITDKADCPTQTDTQTKTASVVINVEPVTDIAEMPDTITATGDEDSYIHIEGLGAILYDNDGSETIALNLSGLPAGAVLFYSPDNGESFVQLPNNGTSWSFDISQASNIYIRPPQDFSGDIKLKLDAITNEIGTTDIQTSTTDVIIGVNPIGDDVQFFGVPETLSGTEGDSFTIPVNIESYETNSDESLRLTVIFSAANRDQLHGLDKIKVGDQEIQISQKGEVWFATAIVNSNTFDEFTLFTGDAFGDIDIQLIANTVDSNTVLGNEVKHEGTPVVKDINLTLTPVPDAPELTAKYNSIIAETETDIALNLALNLTYPAPTEKGTVLITGFPDGYTFSAGKATKHGWEVEQADIANLTMTGNSAQDFTLSIEPIAAIGSQKVSGTTQTIDFKIAESGDNTLVGTANDDLIIGGKGNDIMSGNAGNDSFIFKSEDLGTLAAPAQDTILDFDATANTDNIDLSAILSNVTDGISADNYIDITENNGSVTLHVKDNGADVTQEITLDNVSKDALYGADASSATEAELLQKMIDDNNLVTG
ncbi:RTX toxin [Photobacterium sp. CAIM 1937]|nr:RTX toxin [Vibrio parahaemolyticus]MZG56771.1 RTX toxin [Photobacterium lucens]MZG82509.1 RTX toxin [Photobacterium lucens]